MDVILTTPEQLEALIQKAICKALNINPMVIELPDRCTFKEALEITGLSKSSLYKKTMDKSIPFKSFGKRLIFSRTELKDWMEANTLSKQGINCTLKVPRVSKT